MLHQGDNLVELELMQWVTDVLRTDSVPADSLCRSSFQCDDGANDASSESQTPRSSTTPTPTR